MRIVILLCIFFVTTGIFGQDSNIAAVFDENTRKLDIVFITKILVMLFLGVVAFLSYLKFKNSDKDLETDP